MITVKSIEKLANQGAECGIMRGCPVIMHSSKHTKYYVAGFMPVYLCGSIAMFIRCVDVNTREEHARYSTEFADFVIAG